MDPRYFICGAGVWNFTAYVKMCDDGYFLANKSRLKLKKNCDFFPGLLKSIEEDVVAGRWREVRVEEFVLMFPITNL